LASIAVPSSPSCPVRSSQPSTLAALRGDEVATVVAVDGDDALASRLHDLGFWPGTVVQRLATAPFGDPVLFWLRGFRLALRCDEAARVRVTVDAGAGPESGR
jgi:ferrous iron transport protein A